MAVETNEEGIQALFHDPDGPIADIITKKALLVQGEVRRRILQGPATGRVYKRTNPTRIHQASAPGEAPAGDLGYLAASTGILVEDGDQGITGYIFYSPDYGLWVEMGTRHMAPRPNLRPSLEVVNR